MKYIMTLSVLVLMVSCGQMKTETTALTTENTITLETVSGDVKDIAWGKDGYTAKVVTAANAIYYVTISRANLKHPEQYKSVQIGEQLNVSGDFWMMDGMPQITAREILE